MALTILEASKLNDGDVKRQAVVEMFAENSDILSVLPFEDVVGGSLTYTKEGSLPAVAFRGINESWNDVNARGTGVINPETEVLRIGGGDLDVDKALVKTRGIQVRDSQERMKIKAMSLYLTGKIINGDSTVNPREFDGLRARVTGSQMIPADLAAPTANSALSLHALDAAIDAVDGATHLIMSKTMRNYLSSASRNNNVGGFITYTQDTFGNEVHLFRGLRILIADYDDDGQKIIDFNEAGPAGGTDSTSIYAVAFGDDKVTGIQNGLMEVEDLGALPETPAYRTRIEWLVGLAIMHGRAVSRLWGIQDGFVTI